MLTLKFKVKFRFHNFELKIKNYVGTSAVVK